MKQTKCLGWKVMCCMQGVSTVGVGLVPVRMKNTGVRAGRSRMNMYTGILGACPKIALGHLLGSQAIIRLKADGWCYPT